MLRVLLDAAAKGKYFTVVVAEGRPNSAGSLLTTTNNNNTKSTWMEAGGDMQVCGSG